MAFIRRSLILLPVVASLLLYGCAHYEVGDGSTAPFSTLQILPIKNDSLAPQANEVVNHDLREVFIQSRKVSVTNEGAEAVLNVTLTKYTHETIATNSQDTGLARKYALTLTALCTLDNPAEDTVYFKDRAVSVDVDIYLDSGQTRAETNAIPLLSKKLSQAIANEVLQVW